VALTTQTNIQYLKGVGEKRAVLLGKLGIHTVGDLLFHFPRDYLDLSAPLEIAAAPLAEPCPVRATLTAKSGEQRIRKGLSVFKLEAEDHSGHLSVTIFNSKYTVDSLQIGRDYIFYGKVGGTLLRREMASPAIYPGQGQASQILAIYPQTAGVNSKYLRNCVAQALELCEPPEDPLPPDVLKTYGFGNIADVLRDIHLPPTLPRAHAARRRFIFQELLVFSCAISILGMENQVKTIRAMSPKPLDAYYNALPYSLTQAQMRCIGEAVADMCRGVPMNRLLQGDVGSGKTAVAAACAYFAFLSGAQSAVMAPTEILAEQHYATFSGMLEHLGVRCALLTGSTKGLEKNRIRAALAAGETDLCIGTHALLSDGVEFKNLELVITDEQHRFGVAQRAKLSQKSEEAHVLVMSATPIPRTLSLIIYGDLSLSVLDQLPPGRQPVETLVISSAKRTRALNFIKKALDEGSQAYIVCPLVEQGEIDTGLLPAVEYARRLSKKELAGYRVGLLHGKMKAPDKEEAMRKFKSGQWQVLVSTTVVEVGVDVPGATIILIENAERFGLSQLHQLRGRVGRGSKKSYCILVSDARGDAVRSRLGVMKRTNDGFAVAEHDLKLRGPGDFFGHRQHGLPEMKVANLAGDMEVLQIAQDCARQILARDEALGLPEHAALHRQTQAMLEAVGRRPN